MTATLSTLITADLIAEAADPIPVRITVSWSTDDPYVVALAFHTGRDDAADVEWLVGRELLTDALADGEAGRGDVRIWQADQPDQADRAEGFEAFELTCMELTSPFGRALFEFGTPELAEFLEATYEQVEEGFELAFLDWDAEITELLNGATDEYL
jgi:hypothetical protein